MTTLVMVLIVALVGWAGSVYLLLDAFKTIRRVKSEKWDQQVEIGGRLDQARTELRRVRDELYALQRESVSAIPGVDDKAEVDAHIARLKTIEKPEPLKRVVGHCMTCDACAEEFLFLSAHICAGTVDHEPTVQCPVCKTVNDISCSVTYYDDDDDEVVVPPKDTADGMA